jgi:hypothetical protein
MMTLAALGGSLPTPSILSPTALSHPSSWPSRVVLLAEYQELEWEAARVVMVRGSEGEGQVSEVGQLCARQSIMMEILSSHLIWLTTYLKHVEALTITVVNQASV